MFNEVTNGTSNQLLLQRIIDTWQQPISFSAQVRVDLCGYAETQLAFMGGLNERRGS
jgi:hypothetical protein